MAYTPVAYDENQIPQPVEFMGKEFNKNGQQPNSQSNSQPSQQASQGQSQNTLNQAINNLDKLIKTLENRTGQSSASKQTSSSSQPSQGLLGSLGNLFGNLGNRNTQQQNKSTQSQSSSQPSQGLLGGLFKNLIGNQQEEQAVQEEQVVPESANQSLVGKLNELKEKILSSVKNFEQKAENKENFKGLFYKPTEEELKYEPKEKSLLGIIVEIIADILRTIVRLILLIVQVIGGFILDVIGEIVGFFVNIIKFIVNMIMGLVDTIIVNPITRIYNFIKREYYRYRKLILDILHRDRIINLGIRDGIVKVIDFIGKLTPDLLRKLVSLVENIITTIYLLLSGSYPRALTVAREIVDEIRGLVKAPNLLGSLLGLLGRNNEAGQ